MKNQLSDIYEQILLTESEKNSLTKSTNDNVGNLKPNQEAFGEKPEAVAGPEKAKIKQGPSYKISTSSETGVSYSKQGSSFKGTKEASEAEKEEATDMKEEEVVPETEANKTEETEETEQKITSKNFNNNDKYNKPSKSTQVEQYTMSAFETLFKKTLTEEVKEPATDNQESLPVSDSANSVSDETEQVADTEDVSDDVDESETEGDLIADLHELKSKLETILSKLESDLDSDDSEAENSEDDFTDEDYEDEFGTEDGEDEDGEETEDSKPVVTKESVEKPKPLSPSKGKQLISKNNKVGGKIKAKGGKAYAGNLKNDPSPKSLASKTNHLTKGNSEVKSTVKKGDFIK